ncbi:MAG: TIM barrel protein [Firmicutes bacterium]|nr:TIM barrel protein [Bacillota bacterium]
MSINIAIGQLNQADTKTMQFARQLGVNSIQFNTPDIPGNQYWGYKDLLNLNEKCEKFGLKLEAIENMPLKFYDKIMLDLPGKEEQIKNIQRTIINMGRVGIPILGYHFEPTFVWRTAVTKEGRGGAKVTVFDQLKAKQGINIIDGGRRDIKVANEMKMWENYKYFIRNIIPAAEEAGVKLALHPSDPPINSLGGVPRLFKNIESFQKAMKLADSEVWGIDLCLGTFSEMEGGAINVIKAINYFGSLDKILYIHFRDVQGTVPNFKECFLGEGNYNPAEVISLLYKVNFDGFLISDHVPQMIDDSEWGHRARAHAIGYIQGLLTMFDFKDNKKEGARE